MTASLEDLLRLRRRETKDMFPILVILLDLHAKFFNFYVDNRTVISAPQDLFWTGSAWDVIQGIGALATAGALGFIIIQTISIRKQTNSFEKQLEQGKKHSELLQKDMDYRFRPWLYPVETRWPDQFVREILIN